MALKSMLGLCGQDVHYKYLLDCSIDPHLQPTAAIQRTEPNRTSTIGNMSSYAITGASRGIGWAFLTNLSSNPANTVIALVRNKAGTEERIAKELAGRTNVHVVHADLDNYKTLQFAADETARITGGGLDYLIANAAFVETWDLYDPIGVLGKQVPELEDNLLKNFKTNVIAQIHLFNLFTPLILKGTAKKVIALTSAHSDIELVRTLGMANAPSYAIGKAGLNMAIAKFGAQYASEGVLFLAICPGLVDTGHFEGMSEHQQAAAQAMFAKFKEYSPRFNGARPADDSVRDILSVIENATVEKNGGDFLSHKGSKTWI
ncbi:short chain dehydrogenase (AtsC) [Aspergillus flavus]|nr:short chain dehydrogenase (AtsC) [Aspergillus flavus]